MIVGAAGELPKPPAEPIKFLEDMDDTELADAVRPIIPDPFFCSDSGPSLGCLSV